MAVAAVPLLTSMGVGAGTAATIGTIMSVASTGMGVLSAVQTMRGGQMQQQGYNFEAAQFIQQADFERTRAKQEEANRQARLTQILGNQMAMTAGRGIQIGGGSDIAIAEFSEEEAKREDDIASLDSKYRQSQLTGQATQSRLAGSAAAYNAKTKAMSTLFSTGTSLLERMPTT